MDDNLLGILLAVVGVAIPVGFGLYEFVIKELKRLGYRVQMDTTAIDEVPSPHAGALRRLDWDDGQPLVEPSFVLLRFENRGRTRVEPQDYTAPADDKVGVRVSFPGRRLAGVAVTELSDPVLARFFDDGGLAVRDGVIQLPRVELKRGAHYKVLAVLDREPGTSHERGTPFLEPKVVGGIRGRNIRETSSRTGTHPVVLGLIGALVAVIVAQFLVSLQRVPLDCAEGDLRLVGSSAFKEILEEAGNAYADACGNASFDYAGLTGSGQGVTALKNAVAEQEEGVGEIVAFSDGARADVPQLVARPVALLLFSVVVHKDAGVQTLSLQQVRDLFAGKYTNWTQVGGNDVPVALVERSLGSGTRNALEKRVLGVGSRDIGADSLECRETDRPKPPRCVEQTTDLVLARVAGVSGAIGYSEIGSAVDHPAFTEQPCLSDDCRGGDGFVSVHIDGQEATLDSVERGSYPYWETEFAYTYGQPDAESLAASFLRYLASGMGRDIVLEHGHRPCTDLQRPLLCRPEATSPSDD